MYSISFKLCTSFDFFQHKKLANFDFKLFCTSVTQSTLKEETSLNTSLQKFALFCFIRESLKDCSFFSTKISGIHLECYPKRKKEKKTGRKNKQIH